MKFKVDPMAVTCQIVNGEIKNRIGANPQEISERKIEKIIGISPSVLKFMSRHKSVFRSRRSIPDSKTNLFYPFCPRPSRSNCEFEKPAGPASPGPAGA